MSKTELSRTDAAPETQTAERDRRQRVFKQHILECPCCAREENDMCTVGYQLLRDCLK